MSDTPPPFAFSQFVPGFDFLKSLGAGAAPGAAAMPGAPSLASWVAPTLNVEELDKRIQELKTVQYWLEQNGHALKATIQALEVQKMTLSTLRGMNVQMEDLAKVFTRPVPSPAAAAPPAAPPVAAPAADAAAEPAAPPAAAPGVVDPMQWWNALTEQFQHIASSALQDAAHLKMPTMPTDPVPGAAAPAASSARAGGARKPSAARKNAAPAAARKTPAAPRRPRG